MITWKAINVRSWFKSLSEIGGADGGFLTEDERKAAAQLGRDVGTWDVVVAILVPGQRAQRLSLTLEGGELDAGRALPPFVVDEILKNPAHGIIERIRENDATYQWKGRRR